MRRALTASAIAGLGLAFTGFLAEPRFSPELLAALDPSRLASAICGARQSGSALARELLIAQAEAAPASQSRSIPLYDDLAGSSFPATVSDP